MKDKVLFVAILGLALTGGVLAFTNPFDLPIVFAQVSEEKTVFEQGQDYTTYKFVNGTFQLQTHQPYFETEIGNFVPYRLNENSDIIQVEVDGGKYVFDKSTGGLTTFVNGIETIQSDSYIVRSAELNTDNWFNLEVNQSPVTVFVSEQNFDNITITVRKQNDEGIFDIDYFISFGLNKATAKFTNSIYPNHKFAFTETLNLVNPVLSLNEQEIDITNYIGQSFPREILEQNEDLIIELQGMFYSSGLGFDNLWSVGIFEDNRIALDYANVEQTQTEIGQTVELDPSVGLSATGVKVVAGSGGHCGQVTGTSYNDMGTWIYISSRDQGTYCRSILQPMSTSAIPNGSTVTGGSFSWSYSMSTANNNWTGGDVVALRFVSGDSLCTNTNYNVLQDVKASSVWASGRGGYTTGSSSVSGTITSSAYSDIESAINGDDTLCLALIPNASQWTTSAYVHLEMHNSSRFGVTINYTVPPPDDPTGLTVTQDTAGELDLSWSQTGSFTGFKIERSLDNSSWTTLTSNTGTTATTYTDTSLSANTLYYYRVFSYNSGTSQYSTGSTSSSQTTWDYPEQVTGLSATDGDPISLSWSAPASDDVITGYKLYRDTNYIKTVTGTSTTDAPPNYGQTYSYTVSAVSGVGEGSQSTSASATYGSPPDPPTGVSTSINNPNPNPFDITVSWSAPANVGSGTLTGFEIYRDASLVTTVGLVTSYTDTVSGIGTYTYTVRAVSNHGTSTDSNSSQISTPIEPDAPSLTLAINNPDPSPFDITVSFTEGVSNGGSSVTGYNLYSSPDDITYTLVASGLSSPYTTTVSSEGTWYFKAEAINNAGTSALSTAYNITTPTVPDAPSLTLAINDPNGLPFDITSTFNAPTNNGGSAITNYNLYYSSDDVTYTSIVNGTTNAYTYTVSGVGTHYFKAEANNNVGSSVLSTSYSIATPTEPDAPSLSLAINNPDPNPFDITVSFTEGVSNGGSSVTGYNLYSSPDDVTYTLEASAVTTSQTITVANVGTWYFKAEAINNAGTSSLSSAYSIATPTEPDAPSLSLAINNPDPNPLDVTVSFVNGTSNGGSSVTGYNLYSSPDNITYTSIVNATSSPYTTTVSNSGTWYFKAESINNAGTSALSSAYSIATPTVPDAVTDLTYVTGTNTSLSVSWSAPNNGGSAITLYKMFVDGSQVDTTTNTSYTFTGLTTKTSYDLTVFATNNIGDSSVSNTVTETVWGVPDAVTNLTASSTLSSITLNYDAAVPYGYPVTGYKLERESPVGGGFTVLSTNIGNVTTYTNTGLSPVTEYNYRITPLSSIGDGVSATISYTSLPPAPTGLTASSTITGNMDLSWTAPSPSTGVTGYHIQRADGVGNAYATIVADTGNTNTTYTDTGLTQGIVYVYRVAAITPFGESTYSNTYSMTTYYLPNAVTDLTVTTNNLLQFVLNWSQPTLYGTFTGYQLNYTTPAGTPQTIYSSSIQDTNTKISGFDPTVQFSFRVAPITIHGTNATGNIVTAQVTSQIEIGDISVSGQATPDTRDIVFSMETLDNNTNVITATFDPALELNCEISQPALGTTQDYPSISETLDGADAYHEFTINNSAGNIVEIDCHDTTDNTITASYTLRTDEIGNNTTDSIISIQQIKDFTDGTLGGSDSIGGVSLIILAVGIIGMIGFNRTHPAIGIGMFVVVMGGARYFNLIGDVEGVIGIIALLIVLAVAGAERISR